MTCLQSSVVCFFSLVLLCTKAERVVVKARCGNETSINETSARINLANLPDYIAFAKNDKKYGNWCGEENGAGPTINDIDQCCKAHDDCHKGNCYENPENCECNKTFKSCVGRAKSSCRWWQYFSSYCRNARAIYDYADEASSGACYGEVSNGYYMFACPNGWGPVNEEGDYDYD